MKRLAALIAVVPTSAFAHGGPEGHMHPHGLEAAAVALLGFGMVWVIWRLAK